MFVWKLLICNYGDTVHVSSKKKTLKCNIDKQNESTENICLSQCVPISQSPEFC